MEVHHHAHTSRKKWTHYFWEFLMLFLAVTLGFFVENQREHYIEHRREKQFIASLLNDLGLDTITLNAVISARVERTKNIDSALFPLTKLATDRLPSGLYSNLYNSMFGLYFFPNNGTVTQLKSSGGLRLIRKRYVVDSVESYDQQVRRLMVRQDDDRILCSEYQRILFRLLSGKDVFDTFYDSTYAVRSATPERTIKIDRTYLTEIINHLLHLRNQTRYDNYVALFAKQKARVMIEFLKKEYRLK